MLMKLLQRFNQTALNWFILLADGTIKGCAILAMFFLFLKLRRQTRPQTRHLILFIGMISVLLIPLVTQGIAVLGRNQLSADFLAQGVFGPDNPQLQSSDGLASAPILISSRTSGSIANGIQLPHWTVWLFLIWIIGLISAAGKWMIENLRAYELGRKGRPVHDPQWSSLLEDLKASAGVNLPVTLKFNAMLPFPLVLGWLRPVILLPDSAGDWTADRRRAILLHELSHIRRYDNLSQILATVTAIIFWFNPLVWLALKRLKTNRELACDDRVLEAGVLPSVYATHLLAVIRNLRANSLKLKTLAAISSPMAAPNLEQRMVNILTKHMDNHKSLTKPNVIGIALIALLIVTVCSLGSLIGLAADNQSDPFIQDPLVSIQGDQLQLNLQGTILQGTIQEFPVLWPEQGVKNRIASPFGIRLHPIFKEYKLHTGIDIVSPKGTPIMATADGEVMAAEFRGSNSYGNYIAIKHKYLTSTYSQLDRILVSSGDKVRRGELIAYSGDSGINTGPHLHYEIRYGKTWINPQPLAGISQ